MLIYNSNFMVNIHKVIIIKWPHMPALTWSLLRSNRVTPIFHMSKLKHRLKK